MAPWLSISQDAHSLCSLVCQTKGQTLVNRVNKPSLASLTCLKPWFVQAFSYVARANFDSVQTAAFQRIWVGQTKHMSVS